MIPDLPVTIPESMFSAEAFLSASVVLSLFVYITHLVHRLVDKQQARKQNTKPAYTLYLRQLKEGSDNSMLCGSKSGNIFVDEFNLLTDLLFPKLDFAVMKALNQDIPLLSKQEHLHAKMHNASQKERKQDENSSMGHRWDWYIFIADLFLLRMGKEISCGTAGFAEATSGIWFYLPMKYGFNTRNFMNNEYVYHALEELEHGPLTTQYLWTQVWTLTPLFLYPVQFVIYFCYFLLPPVFTVLFVHPSWIFCPKTYIDAIQYYAVFVPVYVLTMYTCFMYWVLPFREDDVQHEQRYKYFCEVVKERGIQFDVVDSCTY